MTKQEQNYLEWVPQACKEANDQRKENGESTTISIAEGVIALHVAQWWAEEVCNPTFDMDVCGGLAAALAEKLSQTIDENANDCFIKKVTKHLLVKLPRILNCDYHPDPFFEEALGENFPEFEMNFPWKAYMTINWSTGEIKSY